MIGSCPKKLIFKPPETLKAPFLGALWYHFLFRDSGVCCLSSSFCDSNRARADSFISFITISFIKTNAQRKSAEGSLGGGERGEHDEIKPLIDLIGIE